MLTDLVKPNTLIGIETETVAPSTYPRLTAYENDWLHNPAAQHK